MDECPQLGSLHYLSSLLNFTLFGGRENVSVKLPMFSTFTQESTQVGEINSPNISQLPEKFLLFSKVSGKSRGSRKDRSSSVYRISWKLPRSLNKFPPRWRGRAGQVQELQVLQIESKGETNAENIFKWSFCLIFREIKISVKQLDCVTYRLLSKEKKKKDAPVLAVLR